MNIYIRRKPLPGEYLVTGGALDGATIRITGHQPYPGQGRVNYTAAEWEREVNACADYACNFSRPIDAETYRAFVEYLQSDHDGNQSRLLQMVERGKIDAEIAQKYICDFVPPLGTCYWNDGWQCTPHDEIMEVLQ